MIDLGVFAPKSRAVVVQKISRHAVLPAVLAALVFLLGVGAAPPAQAQAQTTYVFALCPSSCTVIGDPAPTELAAVQSMVSKYNASHPETLAGGYCSSSTSPVLTLSQLQMRIAPTQNLNPPPGDYWWVEIYQISSNCAAAHQPNNGHPWAVYASVCSAGTRWLPEAGCTPVRDRLTAPPRGPANACYGNPIYPLTGQKRQTETLLSALGQTLEIVYDTQRQLPLTEGSVDFTDQPAPSFNLETAVERIQVRCFWTPWQGENHSHSWLWRGFSTRPVRSKIVHLGA
jgi:hypothetical protein